MRVAAVLREIPTDARLCSFERGVDLSLSLVENEQTTPSYRVRTKDQFSDGRSVLLSSLYRVAKHNSMSQSQQIPPNKWSK